MAMQPFHNQSDNEILQQTILFEQLAYYKFTRRREAVVHARSRTESIVAMQQTNAQFKQLCDKTQSKRSAYMQMVRATVGSDLGKKLICTFHAVQGLAADAIRLIERPAFQCL